MSDAKLQAARELIQEREFGAARAVLETMPYDETAQEWLSKLDKVAPRTTWARVLLGLLAVIALGVCVVVIVGLFVNLQQQGSAQADQIIAYTRTIDYCAMQMPNVERDECRSMVTIGDVYVQCHVAAREDDVAYYACMNRRLWCR